MSSTDLICQYHTLLPIAIIGGKLNYMQQFSTKKILLIIPYSTVISRNLNFADSCLHNFRSINFAIPARYGRALVGVGNFHWISFAEAVVSAKTAKIKSHEI